MSGGYSIPNFEVVGGGSYKVEAYAYSSRRTGGREWTVSALSYGSDPATLVAYAYCREDDGVKSKSASTTVTPGDAVGTATAKCAKGQRVVSGGFDNPDFDPAPGRRWCPSP